MCSLCISTRSGHIHVLHGKCTATVLLQVKYDFVEVMTCPGGCIGGGGQPKTKDPLAISKVRWLFAP